MDSIRPVGGVTGAFDRWVTARRARLRAQLEALRGERWDELGHLLEEDEGGEPPPGALGPEDQEAADELLEDARRVRERLAAVRRDILHLIGESRGRPEPPRASRDPLSHSVRLGDRLDGYL